MRKLDLNLLAALDVLLKEHSVTKAAAVLNVSQSAMSHTLARLRELTGDQLLVRGANGLVPTLRAEELHEPVRSALQHLGDALAPREFLPEHITRTFRLSTTDYVESLVCPLLIERLRSLAPHARLKIDPRTSSGADDDDVLSGQSDLAIGFAHKARNPVHRSKLLEETFSVLMRSPAYAPETPSLDWYLAAPHIVVSTYGNFSGVTDAALVAMGHTRNVVMTTPHYLAAAEIVCRSDLVLTVQSRLARHFAKRMPVAVLPLPFAVRPIKLNMIWSARTHADPAQKWLRGQVADIARGLRPAA